MATYLELYALRTNETLLQRLSVAILVAVDLVRAEDPSTPQHANRASWAIQALKNPDLVAEKALALLLVANKTLTVANINNVTDDGIQTAVNGLINTLAGSN
jgi:hypothetical protein